MLLVLVSGLPRSGKSSFADALAAAGTGFTHVPLDKYILPVPADATFLEWVDQPRCIDWSRLADDLGHLAAGRDRLTPAPDWNDGGRRRPESLTTGSRALRAPQRGCVIPGCHAFRMPPSRFATQRVFIATPPAVIAARLAPMDAGGDPLAVLDARLSPGWRAIDAYRAEADLVLPGDASAAEQLWRFSAWAPG